MVAGYWVACLLGSSGCYRVDSLDAAPDTDDTGSTARHPSETDKNGDSDPDTACNAYPNRGYCAPSLTCDGLDLPDDCIANFELGTIQAGFEGNYGAVGFHAYSDGSEYGTMEPVPNFWDAEPAVCMGGCGETDGYVLHMSGEGFTNWGAGVEMYWGGPHNPSCDVDGAMDCLGIAEDDPNFYLEKAAADPRCDTEEKLDCLTRGPVLLEPRDLSDYVGIGFWVARTHESSASLIKVLFPIPDTMRFYGACSEDDDDSGTGCFNDFATTLRLSNAEVGKWVFKYILFEDLAINPYWGLQLDIPEFPREESLGIKFQVGQNQIFDFYIDDIILLREAVEI